MEIRNLKTFQVVAEKLNITTAAKELRYTQPTVTLQIQSLEQELNHKLLTRVGKKTFLTVAGKKLKIHADNLLAYVEEIEKEMRELHGPTGVLTVAASDYYCTRHLPLLLKAYTEMYPEVQVNLLPLNSTYAIQSVRNQVADIAIIASEVDANDLKKIFLEEEQTLLVASSKISKDKQLEDIFSNYPFISYHDDCSFSEITDEYFKRYGAQPQSTIVCGGSDETIKRIVLNDTGYAIIGKNVITNELKDGSITILEKVSEPMITSAVNLKVRSEESNILTFNELLQNAWPLVSN